MARARLRNCKSALFFVFLRNSREKWPIDAADEGQKEEAAGMGVKKFLSGRKPRQLQRLKSVFVAAGGNNETVKLSNSEI